MTKRQFVVLAFRLFALYLGFQLIAELGLIFRMIPLEGGSVLLEVFASLFSIAIVLVGIALIWTKSEWLMQKIFAIPVLSDDVVPIEEEPTTEGHVEAVSEMLPNIIEIQDYYETPLSKESIELVAISLMGLWAVLTNIPSFVSQIYASFGNPFSLSMFGSIGAILTSRLLQLALGVWLFLRPWQFQGWIEKFKPKVEEMENNP